MKRIFVILTVAFLILSARCFAEDSIPQTTINVFSITTTYVSEKNYGQLTARVTRKQTSQDIIENGLDTKIYGVEQVACEKTDSGYEYVFNFEMPEDSKTGTYTVDIGGLKKTTTEFEYVNIMDKVNYYNVLNMALAEKTDEHNSVYECLTGEDYRLTYDLTNYKNLRPNVRLLIDKEIAEMDLSATIENVKELDERFCKEMDRMIELAFYLNIDSSVNRDDFKEYINKAQEKNIFDSTGYDKLPIDVLLKYVIQGMPQELNKELISKAFSQAVVLATIESMDAESVKEIFEHYLDCGILSIDRVKYGDIKTKNLQITLFKNLKNKTNSTIKDVENNVNNIMIELLSKNASKPTGGGTGGGNKTPNKVNNTITIGTPDNNKQEVTNDVSFDDVSKNHWAFESIRFLTNKKILDGRDNDKFYPEDTITRAEFVKLVVLAFECYDDTAETNFKDVSKNDWFYKYIASAVKMEMVSGLDDLNFAPNSNITRQDAAVILYRIYTTVDGTIKKEKAEFADTEQISDYAKTAVSELCGIGVINGMDDGSFRPNADLTRAQAAKIVCELIGVIGGSKS